LSLLLFLFLRVYFFIFFLSLPRSVLQFVEIKSILRIFPLELNVLHYILCSI
jgi:hypothetical protein